MVCWDGLVTYSNIHALLLDEVLDDLELPMHGSYYQGRKVGIEVDISTSCDGGLWGKEGSERRDRRFLIRKRQSRGRKVSKNVKKWGERRTMGSGVVRGLGGVVG